jgi:hypothetical protein
MCFFLKIKNSVKNAGKNFEVFLFLFYLRFTGDPLLSEAEKGS